MKIINHANLQLYINMFRQTIYLINNIGIMKLLVSLIFSVLIFLVFYAQYRFRSKQEKSIWKQFGLISKNNCLSLRLYYMELLKIFDRKLLSLNKEEQKKDLCIVKNSEVEEDFCRFLEILEGLSIENQPKPSSKMTVMD